MNLPNKITIFRVIMIPVFLVLLLVPGIPYGNYIATAVFVIACASDAVDGNIARKYNLVTNFGKFMDPLADKALQISGVLCLSIAGILENYILLIVLCAKELFVVVGGALVSKKINAMVISNAFGKFASFFMSFCICLMFFAGEGGWVEQFNKELNVLIYIALVLSVIAMIQYTVIGLKKMKNQRDK